MIPGALIEAPIVLWYVADAVLFGRLPQVQILGAGAALGALTLPLGFLASNIYSAVVWHERRATENSPGGSRLFGWVDEPRLAAAWGGPIAPSDDLPTKQAAWLDGYWHSRLDAAGLVSARGRGRSLLDLSNGLASSMTALAIAGAILVEIAMIMIVASSWLLLFDGLALVLDAPSSSEPMFVREGRLAMRAAFAASGAVVCFAYLWLLKGSQRRVARTAEHFIEATLTEANRRITLAERGGRTD